MLYKLYFIICVALGVAITSNAQSQEQEFGPEFGLEAYTNWISDNLRYPAEAKKKRIQGIVKVTFIVEEDGSLSDLKVAEGLGSGCDEEALRLIKEHPHKWKLAKNINYRLATVSIPFELK